MKITAILENTKQDKKVIAKHGLSLYIEMEEINIIFDLGPDRTYIKNAKALGIDLNKAHATIISHGHSDHIGGFHLIGLPILNTLGKTEEEVMAIGRTLDDMPINCIYSCHCTGPKAYKMLKTILKEKLHAFSAGESILLR